MNPTSFNFIEFGNMKRIFCVIFVILFIIRDINCSGPSITNLPATINVLESQTASLTSVLFTLAVSDTDPFTCYIQTVTPPPSSPAFSLVDDSGTFKFYLSTNPGFAVSVTDTYTVTIQCDDNTGNTSTGDLIVKLTNNQAPVISGLPTTASISENVPLGYVVYTLTVADPESDPFTCVLTPNDGMFKIHDVGSGFEVRLESALPDTNDRTLNITCSDSWGGSWGIVTVTVSANLAPVFPDLPKTVTVSESAAGGTNLDILNVIDADSATISCSISPSAPNFEYNSATDAINLAASHTLNAATQSSYAITVTCTDGIDSTNGILNVNVLQNARPVFGNLPATETVAQGSTVGTLVYTVTVTDTDAFSCTISSQTPDDGTLGLQFATPNYRVTLAKDITVSHTADITCSDQWGSSTGTLTVTTMPNQPPVISGLPTTASVSQKAAVGYVVHTLAVTDAESNPFTCTIAQSPDDGTFNIQYISSNYEIRLAKTLSAGDRTVDVTCADSWGSNTGTLTVAVVANQPPAFTGLPTSVSAVESYSAGTVLHTLTVTDPDVGDTVGCSIASSPASSNFEINSGTGQIKLAAGHSLSQNSYTVTVTCTDGTDSTDADLIVNVLQNSPPAFGNLPASQSVAAGTAVGTTVYTVTATDAENNPFSCSISSQSPNDGTLGLQFNTPNYEVKLQKAVTNTHTVDVTCADQWGSSTATLTLVGTVNLPPVISGLPTAVTVNEADAAGTSVYTMTVTDTDSFLCDISSSPTTSNFVIDQINNVIKLSSGHDLKSGPDSYDLTITCTDTSSGTATGLLAVNVDRNSPPDITSLPAAGSVTSGTNAKTKLHDLVVTDAESDFYTCIETSVPAGPFSLEFGTAYALYQDANPTYTASSYAISITCSDAYGSTTEVFTLTVDPNSDPVITGMPITVTASETEVASRDLHTIAVTDAESHTISCSVSSVPPGPFSIDQNPATPSYKVVLDANAIDSLDAVTNPSHTVTVTCTDSAGGSTTGTLIVDITENSAPTVDNLPDHFELSENSVLETEIWNLGYTDAESDTVTCSIATNPAGSPLDLRESGTPNDYRLWIQSNPNLNYSAVQTIEVTFTCTDHHNGRTGRSSSGVLYIDILENRPPVFTSAAAITQNAQSTPINTIFHQCVTTDADTDDTVSYSVTITPDTGSFNFNPATCEFSSARDLKYELEPFFTATITADDGRDTTVQTLSITLTNINTAPVIQNIGLNQLAHVYFDETTPTDTLLFSPTVYDPDAGQTQTITYSVFPAAEVDMFDVSTTEIKLKNGKVFDYEDISNYKLTMYVTDTYATTGPYFLEVHVGNVPEVCGFDKVIYEASTYEAGKDGGRIDIGFTVSDEDDPDYHTFSLINNPHSQYYQIDQYTGQISFKTNYDVDACGFGHPANATLVVQCTDTYGETGTATVSVYVQDYNDNKPQCSSTGNVLIASQWTQNGGLLGKINGTDCDSDLNAKLAYYGASATGNAYYTVTASGAVYKTNTEIDFPYGTEHKFLITVKDQGTPQLSSTCELTIIYRYETTTTSTTTEANTPRDWWDKPENVALVAILALLTLFLLAFLAYLCCRRGMPCNCRSPFDFCKKCCKPPRPTKKIVTPKNPKQDPFKFFDHNDLNVKREMFSTKARETDTIVPMKM